VETHHADGVHLIAVGGNYGRDLGNVTSWQKMDSDEAILRGLADRLGFIVYKKRGKKK
jgi:hypothetical protein